MIAEKKKEPDKTSSQPQAGKQAITAENANELHVPPMQTRDLSGAKRQQLALMITSLFQKWSLKNREQLSLLGLSPNSKALLYKYKEGKSLPNSRDLLDRVAMLLSIHQSLRLLYPRNPTICYGWITMANTLFARHTPLQVMEQKGYLGILQVYSLLQHMRRR